MSKQRKWAKKADRERISLFQITDMFPDERAARTWFEGIVWGDERVCGHCGSFETSRVPKEKPMPYWCKDCRSYFSVKTGTAIARSNVSLRKWAMAVFLSVTSLKSVSSYKLANDIGVSQKTAWFMMHRLREAWAKETGSDGPFDGPVEVDEAYFGGKRENMSNSKRAALREQGFKQGPAGKTAVVGIKDRDTKRVSAKVIERTDRKTLQGFVAENVTPGAIVYTDEAKAYQGLPYPHESVKHSVSEYVRDMAHTNGVESFWSMLKRAHMGTFHKLSPKHLNRYVQEFAAKHNIREQDTLDQMRTVVAGLVGRNLLYRELIADNGLDAEAQAA